MNEPTSRPRHFLALDRLAALGNRSASNPFLARSFELFFHPFGLTARHVEFAVIESARGSYPPLYLHGARFSLEFVKAAGTQLELFAPLLAAPARVEVVVGAGPSLSLRLRRENGPPPDASSDALAAALAGGLEERVNDGLRRAEEYFRGFCGAAVRALAEPEAAELQETFLQDPAQFAEAFALALANRAAA